MRAPDRIVYAIALWFAGTTLVTNGFSANPFETFGNLLLGSLFLWPIMLVHLLGIILIWSILWALWPPKDFRG